MVSAPFYVHLLGKVTWNGVYDVKEEVEISFLTLENENGNETETCVLVDT